MLAKPARAISYNSTHYQEKWSKTRCWGWRWFWSWSTGNNFVRLEINFFDYYLGPDRNLDFSHDQCDLGKTRYILSLDIWWIFLPLEEPPYFIKEGSLLSLNIYKTESSHLSRTPTNLDRVPPPLLLSNNRFLEGVFFAIFLKPVCSSWSAHGVSSASLSCSSSLLSTVGYLQSNKKKTF